MSLCDRWRIPPLSLRRLRRYAPPSAKSVAKFARGQKVALEGQRVGELDAAKGAALLHAVHFPKRCRLPSWHCAASCQWSQDLNKKRIRGLRLISARSTSLSYGGRDEYDGHERFSAEPDYGRKQKLLWDFMARFQLVTPSSSDKFGHAGTE